jgi:hypothetical protein
MFLKCTFILALIVSTVSCTPPISVKHVRPVAPPSLTSETVSNDIGLLLDRIAISETKLSSSNSETYRNYNFLVSRLIDEIDKSGAKPWERPIQVKGA